MIRLPFSCGRKPTLETQRASWRPSLSHPEKYAHVSDRLKLCSDRATQRYAYKTLKLGSQVEEAP
jgi:hypothetical protein